MALLACCVGNVPAADADRTPASGIERDAADVKRLIGDLGSREFALRERAQAELQRLGLAAFDALHDAQESDDIEIAIRSRYLLRSLDLRWAREDDPLPVKEILRGYGNKSASERRNLLEQLGALGDGQGIGALCRIVRFDDSNLLSKRAALLVVQQPSSDDSAAMRQVSDLILTEIGPSQRGAANWLRVYADLQDDPEALLNAWEAITRREEAVFHHTPEKSSADIVRDLLRWQADLLERLGRADQALAVVQRTINLLDGSREQLLETVDWLIQREAWPTVESVAERFAERFNDSPLLRYRLAEAQRRQDRRELAEQTAEQALKLNKDNHQDHILAAYSLQERGLFDWAEREYRYVIELGPAGSQHDLRTRFLLSEMLHDVGRNLDAAETLQPTVDAMNNDQNVEYLVRRIGREPGSIRSRMNYFYGEHLRSREQFAEQRERLEEGVKQDPTDADLLIAMYRASHADDAWRKTTLQRIQETAETFREQVRAGEQAVASADNEEIRSIYNRQLAGANNQLAWLISNTEGDYDEALRCSLRSLELRPKTAGYLDTLGRCYFAKGDYEKAVQVQTQAVELEPFSGQIRRQLELFEKAHREASEKTQDGQPGGDGS
ncbi:MAG: tetratricopeptide repeat protein [Pirellulaceae bacterium]|nr:tetratricopeptide repeat protein [Pirellulaceae bacterium]